MRVERTHIKKAADFSPLIALVGPTGVGKSHLALEIAKYFSGEIVNADSRQVYRHMDIGTAKPSAEELASVPHHLYNLINPDEDFSLAHYQEQASQCIREVQSRGNLPILVGGSGQYVWAVLEGWEIPRIAPDLKYREKLETMAAEDGPDLLYEQLQNLDPQAAQKIDNRNVRRVIRALEVIHQAKVPFSKLQTKKAPAFQTLIIGLTQERARLYRRIDSRVEEMVQKGLISETKKLQSTGFDLKLSSLNSIGYKQIATLLEGQITEEEAVRQIKVDTHRFVRHQYAWFRLKDSRIHWFDVNGNFEPEVLALMANFLESFSGTN
jgi:tRNA dimethylallyltransferase